MGACVYHQDGKVVFNHTSDFQTLVSCEPLKEERQIRYSKGKLTLLSFVCHIIFLACIFEARFGALRTRKARFAVANA